MSKFTDEDGIDGPFEKAISEAAGTLGARGGRSRSPAKRQAARANGAKGGRPKGSTRRCDKCGYQAASTSCVPLSSGPMFLCDPCKPGILK